ncbi:hypothetical protein COCMIDRAFT_93020, partial [Bipolaris oryzae ATCC 44560]
YCYSPCLSLLSVPSVCLCVCVPFLAAPLICISSLFLSFSLSLSLSVFPIHKRLLFPTSPFHLSLTNTTHTPAVQSCQSRLTLRTRIQKNKQTNTRTQRKGRKKKTSFPDSPVLSLSPFAHSCIAKPTLYKPAPTPFPKTQHSSIQNKQRKGKKRQADPISRGAKTIATPTLLLFSESYLIMESRPGGVGRKR